MCLCCSISSIICVRSDLGSLLLRLHHHTSPWRTTGSEDWWLMGVWCWHIDDSSVDPADPYSSLYSYQVSNSHMSFGRIFKGINDNNVHLKKTKNINQ